MRDLLDDMAQLHLYDPQVKRYQMFVEFKYTLNLSEETKPGMDSMITTSASAYEAAQGAHAIAVLTEWDQFKRLDYQKIYDSMAKPAFLFDGRNICDHDALRRVAGATIRRARERERVRRRRARGRDA